MQHVFFGHDERVEAGTTVFVRSAIAHATGPLTLTPITRRNVRDVQEGSNAFTYRRFLVPWMLGFRGWAVFVDGADMLCRADLGDLFKLIYYNDAVRVVKHDYRTKHPRKYRGTPMECDNADYDRKNWSSVMLVNCTHFAWRNVTPEFVERANPLALLQLRFIPDDFIGSLPKEWNWLCDEDGENPAAKLLHFTAGIPAFAAHAGAPMADEWHAARAAAYNATGAT
jgi:hypothetical protein